MMIKLLQLFKEPEKIIGTFILTIFLLSAFTPANAQKPFFKPGFDKQEYIELLKMDARLYDTTKNKIPYPVYFRLVYNSTTVGMDNRWNLWKT